MEFFNKFLTSVIVVLYLKTVLSHSDENSGPKIRESLVRLEKLHEDMEEETEILEVHALSAFGENGGSAGGSSNEHTGAASHSGNYVRWGKTVCPSSATTIYSGNAGGSSHTHSGAASNYLCLPSIPEWHDKTKNDNTKSSIGAHVYGAEYQLEGGNEGFFGDKISTAKDDVPCAVCETERPNILMIPGKTSCFDGWSVEYTGFLSAGDHSHTAASEYVCLDKDAEPAHGGNVDFNGKLFYLAEARCGSLPCPPYVNGRIMSCVVCSK